jgi:hypothetical protein
LRNANAGGSTPTIVYGWPSMSIDVPAIPASCPKRRFQSPSLMMATWCVPHCSSSIVKPRPTAGGTPRFTKKADETMRTLTRSASAPPVRLPLRPEKASRCSNDRFCARYR